MLDAVEKRALANAVDNNVRKNDYQGVDILIESLEKILSYVAEEPVKIILTHKDNK